MAMTQSEENDIISKFNKDYMDTVYARVNVFKDGTKIGIRWGLIAYHGEDMYILFYGHTLPRGKKMEGVCIELTHDGNTAIIERTPEQVREWCVKICGGEDKYKQYLSTINEQEWEEFMAI